MSEESEKEKILILGYCLRPHALKGGLALQLFNLDESCMQAGQSFLLIPESSKSELPLEGKEFILKSLSIGPRVIAYFEGIEDISTLEKMIPFKVGMRRSELPVLLEKEEYYLSDMMLLPVYEHGTGKKVGVLKGFYHNKAQMVLVVVRDEIPGMNEKKPNFELPFLDSFFPVIDLINKRVEIRFPKFVE